MYVLLQRHIIVAVVEDRACGCQRWSFSSTRWLGGSGSAVSNHRSDWIIIGPLDPVRTIVDFSGIVIGLSRGTVANHYMAIPGFPSPGLLYQAVFNSWDDPPSRMNKLNGGHFQCVPTDLMWNTGRCHFKREKLVCKPTSGSCFCCFFVPHELKIFIFPAIFVVDGFACHHFPLVAAWWARAFFYSPPSFFSDGSHSKHPSLRSSFWDWLKEPAVNWHDRPNYVLILLIFKHI